MAHEIYSLRQFSFFVACLCVNSLFFLPYDFWGSRKKYFNNYVGTLIKRIKAFLNWAHKKGYHNTLDFKKDEFLKIIGY